MAHGNDLTALSELLARKMYSEVIQAATVALTHSVSRGQILMVRATAYAELGRFGDALADINAALNIVSEAPWAWHLVRVNVLRDLGDLSGALVAAEKLRERHPGRAVLHNTIGLLLRDRGENEDAVRAFRQARDIDSNYSLGYLNAAETLRRMGSIEESATEVERGLSVLPGDADLTLMLGTLYERLGRIADARSQFIRATELNPRLIVEAHKGVARTAYAQADLYGAIRAYRAACEFKDDDWRIWNGIGNCHLDLGQLAEARDAYLRAMALGSDVPGLHDNLLLCRLYDPDVSLDDVFSEHRAWERRFAAVPFQPPPPRRTAKKVRRRLGFFSSGFARGPIGYFLPPLLKNLDRSEYSVYAYSVGAQADEVTVEIQNAVDFWFDGRDAADVDIAQRMRDDGIDILVDLSGHAPGNRLRVMTYRPAPLSASWLDYVNTTGLSSVDLFIGDTISVPDSTTQRFSERVVRIAPCRLCYSPPRYLPDVAASPLLRNGYPTFGSFNRVSKMSDPTLDAWSALMRAVPKSQLILKSAVFASDETRMRFLERFERHGVAANRIVLRTSSEHREMLKEYGDIDVALDTFPFNGGLTTCESLVMGVPVVALLGSTLVSRQSAALLTAANRPDLIVNSRDEWLRRHMSLVDQLSTVGATRSELRAQTLASDLCNGAKFARKFEAVLER